MARKIGVTYDADKSDYKKLDKYKISAIEYAGKRSVPAILAQAAITGEVAPLQVVHILKRIDCLASVQEG